MKFLTLAMLLFSASNAFASGCDHYDVGLESEEIVANLGNFEASYYCHETLPLRCDVYIYNQKKNEYHYLVKQYDGLEEKKPNALSLGMIEVKIFDQYYVSSCGEEHRYTIGVDVDGKRYRKEDDITEM